MNHVKDRTNLYFMLYTYILSELWVGAEDENIF